MQQLGDPLELRHRAMAALQGSDDTLTLLSERLPTLQRNASRRIQKVPVLHVVALVVVLFQLSWLWNTFYPTQRHGKELFKRIRRHHTDAEDDGVIVKKRGGGGGGRKHGSGDPADVDDFDEDVFVDKATRARRQREAELTTVTMDDFKKQIMEEHQSHEALLLRSEGTGDFTHRLRDKKDQVMALQGMANARAEAYKEAHRRNDGASHDGRELYYDALRKRNKALMHPRDMAKNALKEKDADKAKKDQVKWDELLGLEDQEKTAEEVLLLKNAERAAAGLPPIEQMPPPPKSEEEAWSELLALEDAVVARQAAATEAEMTGPPEAEEGVAEAVTGVEEGEAEGGSVRVDYGSAARANEDQAELAVAAIDDRESIETPANQADG